LAEKKRKTRRVRVISTQERGERGGILHWGRKGREPRLRERKGETKHKGQILGSEKLKNEKECLRKGRMELPMIGGKEKKIESGGTGERRRQLQTVREHNLQFERMEDRKKGEKGVIGSGRKGGARWGKKNGGEKLKKNQLMGRRVVNSRKRGKSPEKKRGERRTE